MNKITLRATLLSASLAALSVVPFAASAQADDDCAKQHLAYLGAQERLDKATADPAARQAEEERAEAQEKFEATERDLEKALAEADKPLSDVEHDRLIQPWEKAAAQLDDAEDAARRANAAHAKKVDAATKSVNSARTKLKTCLRADIRN